LIQFRCSPHHRGSYRIIAIFSSALGNVNVFISGSILYPSSSNVLSTSFPIWATYGLFVMNKDKDLIAAMRDFEEGKMGRFADQIPGF
jgi:hypothetical protein